MRPRLFGHPLPPVSSNRGRVAKAASAKAAAARLYPKERRLGALAGGRFGIAGRDHEGPFRRSGLPPSPEAGEIL